jgi:hypothetical protein
VEKCEKRREQDWRAADRSGLRREVYSINGVATTREMRACSACAGDYEDPDRTAWTPDDGEEEERDSARGASKEEFPAED